ncbi:tripartite motif-containing protein 16-like isoform X2 [Mastacembelus armatus]|uniref:tripartite motif-containing protein 16-like isoform X2 n=1 Tax=Mastacembelus armatus TaxID=205130 RepID=UPI000E45797D|nr:tripartite motif-containing protein 16-like isoform X2 [Mastacembelus armatus]XP_026163739.1 tripartite motif-containing protein 16-like isoform X2 [Mastacembelus armatus]
MKMIFKTWEHWVWRSAVPCWVSGCVKNDQEDLRNIQTKSKRVLQKQEEKLKKLKAVLQQIQEEAEQTQDLCEGIVVGVIGSLQKHCLSVRKLIGAQKKAAAAPIRRSLRRLEAKIEELKTRDAELDGLAQTGSDAYFLKEWPVLRELCVSDHVQPSYAAFDAPLQPFEVTKRAVKQLEELGEFCDKEFAAISQTADSGSEPESAAETNEDDVHPECVASTSQAHAGPSGFNSTLAELEAEPKTREEFLQYACQLTLDPDTAHKDLMVSKGDKEVKLIPLTHRGPVNQNPERFIYRRQVLCREGLQAERSYYEIEVKGDKAEIALAYKRIDRKSRINLSAFGGNANSWSLDRFTVYSVSHNNDGVQLTKPPSHQKIGVYLNFKAGVLSFYEVSDSMNFLYKVEAKFTEPLYPGFWLGENCRIRICDLTQ